MGRVIEFPLWRSIRMLVRECVRLDREIRRLERQRAKISGMSELEAAMVLIELKLEGYDG